MSLWGIVPAARRSLAVTGYLLERMMRGGADKLCLVIDPQSSHLLEYFGNRFDGADLAYLVQPQPAGLCDAIFRAHPLIGLDESVALALPDTIWFPDHGLAELPDDELSFLLFPVERPELFDAVLLDRDDRVQEIRARQPSPGTQWIWGACRMPAGIYHRLRALWLKRECRDECFGTLINAYLSNGGSALGRKEAHTYLDVGTLEGYHVAMTMLSVEPDELPARRRDTYI